MLLLQLELSLDLLATGSMALCGGGRVSKTSFEFFEEVTKIIDEGRVVDVVYMNFSKAFDKVSRGLLKQKMKSHVSW